MYEPRDAGHGRQQAGVGKRPRRLRLALHHFTALAQQLIVLGHHRQRRAFVFLVALLAAQQRTPTGLRQETRLGDEFAAGDIQLDHAFAEHRIRTELHQVLARHQPIHIPFILRQIHLAGAGGGNNGVVRIDLFIVPAAVAAIAVDHRLRIQLRLVHADGVQHRVAAGEMFFRQIAAVGTRIGDQFVGFVQPLANVQHLLRAEVIAPGRLDLQRRERERQRRGI